MIHLESITKNYETPAGPFAALRGIVEAIDSLFEPFSRPDRSRTRDTGGYGLGLSLCRRILEAHGGTITVENREPRGALFTLRFPDPG